MTKKSRIIHDGDKRDVDLHDVYELIEIGLDKEEISNELGISKKYIKKMIEDFYDDY
jgi:transcription initiation factor IIE alpha subunit